MGKLQLASYCLTLCLCLSYAFAAAKNEDADENGVATFRGEEEEESEKEAGGGSRRTRRADDTNPLEAVVSRLCQDVAQLQSGLQALQNRASELERPVGFTVRFNHRNVVGLGLNQPVVFDTVDYNVGGGYDKHTGVFTAPASGTYVFVLSLQRLESQETTVIMHIRKGSQDLGSAEAGYSAFEHGAMTVTCHLDQGETITAQTVHGSVVYGNLATIFTGFRVSP